MLEARLSYELGVWTWNAHRRVEGGATFVPAGQLSGWWAHVLDPATPIAWECDESDGPQVFEPVFGEPWVKQATAEMGAASQNVAPHLAPPPVRLEYARIVAVRALSQWLPQPIDVSATRIDEALAWHQVGNQDLAAAAMSVGASSLAAVAHALVTARRGEATAVIPAVVHPAVEEAMHLAMDLLPSDDPDRRVIATLHAELHAFAEPAVDVVADFDEFLARFVTAEPHLALMAGGLTDSVEVLPLDPASIAPRVIEWNGPAESEVTMDAGVEGLALSVRLAEGTHPLDREVRDLTAFSCDAATGEILEHVSMEVGDDGVASATLARQGATRLAVGVYDLSRLDALRTDPLGRHLARFDRVGIARWRALRTKALAAAVGLANDDANKLGEAANALHEQCDVEGRALISRISQGNFGLDQGDLTILTDRHRHLLRSEAATPGLPTIAEALLLVPRRGDMS